jgi:hypothetical protein
MSKLHSYRIQLHCDRQMHIDINHFAKQRGLSQSAAARILIDRSLSQRSDAVSASLDRMENYLESILHASIATRVLTSDIAQNSGVKMTSDEFRERIATLSTRYTKS